MSSPTELPPRVSLSRFWGKLSHVNKLGNVDTLKKPKLSRVTSPSFYSATSPNLAWDHHLFVVIEPCYVVLLCLVGSLQSNFTFLHPLPPVLFVSSLLDRRKLSPQPLSIQRDRYNASIGDISQPLSCLLYYNLRGCLSRVFLSCERLSIYPKRLTTPCACVNPN